MLHTYQSYVGSLKNALESGISDQHKIAIDARKCSVTEHARRFNAPTFKETVLLMTCGTQGKRDKVITRKNNSFKYISKVHRS